MVRIMPNAFQQWKAQVNECLSTPTLSTLSLLLLHNLSILEVEAKEVSKFAGVYSVRSGELN